MQMMQGRTTACKAANTGCTILYAVYAERSCEAIAEWVMFEADLWSVDSLSSTIFSIQVMR